MFLRDSFGVSFFIFIIFYFLLFLFNLLLYLSEYALIFQGQMEFSRSNRLSYFMINCEFPGQRFLKSYQINEYQREFQKPAKTKTRTMTLRLVPVDKCS